MNRLMGVVFKLSVVALVALANVGCDEGGGQYIPQVKVYAFYETIEATGQKKPDVGAKVFYYRNCIENLSGYEYREDGTIMNGDLAVIVPDEQFVIGESGSVFFIPEDQQGSATIVIESHYYHGKIKSAYFATPSDGAGVYVVFKPE